MSPTKLEQFQQALDERARQHLLRKPVCIEQYRGRLISIAGVQYLNFSSNDYLGLATEPLVLQAFADAALSYGAGSSGSPMLTGYHSVHQQLCDTLCDWLGLEQVLLFSSGFAANQAMLHTLAGKQDLLLLDKLSHASLIDGALQSGADFKRFAHNDLSAVAKLLQTYPKGDARSNPPMVVTEGVFSMDGDSPDLLALIKLCREYDAPLLLDDAHGIGVSGAEGRGSLVGQGLRNSEAFSLMANFGKALGVGGAFVGGSKTVIDYLQQFGRHYVYSTALSPALCVAVTKSIELCRRDNWRRDKLHQNIALFRQLADGLPLLASDSAIQAVIIGCSEKALQLSLQLKQQQIWLSAIRAPTVPAGSARLRITLSAQHEDQDIQRLVQQLRLSLQ